MGRIGAGTCSGRRRSPKTSWPSAASSSPSALPTSPQPAMRERGGGRPETRPGPRTCLLEPVIEWVSDHLRVLEPCDVVPRVAEQPGQDLLGMLPELRRGHADGARRIAPPSREADRAGRAGGGKGGGRDGTVT